MTGLGLLALVAIAGGLLLSAANVVQRHTAVNSDGDVVPSNVEALATSAGADDVYSYALARVSASEAGGQKLIAKRAVCWVVLNEAKASGKSVLDVVLGSASTFGHEGTGGRNFVSSARDPSSVDLGVGADVSGELVTDPTGGALHFDSPQAYPDPARADLFAANRESEGFELVTLDGVPASVFRFWRKSA